MDNVGALVVRGYNKDMPPEDDCCPICFDSFQVPSKTSCGHFFCANCILKHWRYTGDDNPCKCPLCKSVITKIVPRSPRLIQQGAEAREILKNVKRYNCLYDDSWLGLFQKTLMLPKLMLHRMREDLMDTRAMIFKYRVYIVALWLSWLLSKFYDFFGFNFIHGGGTMISTCACLSYLVVESFIYLDVAWYRWRRRLRARRMAEDADLHLE